MSFYRLKYMWPKNSTNAIIVNGLRCTQTLSNQLPASTIAVPVHCRHHHILIRSDFLTSAQNVHNNQVNRNAFQCGQMCASMCVRLILWCCVNGLNHMQCRGSERFYTPRKSNAQTYTHTTPHASHHTQ